MDLFHEYLNTYLNIIMIITMMIIMITTMIIMITIMTMMIIKLVMILNQIKLAEKYNVKLRRTKMVQYYMNVPIAINLKQNYIMANTRIKLIHYVKLVCASFEIDIKSQ